MRVPTYIKINFLILFVGVAIFLCNINAWAACGTVTNSCEKCKNNRYRTNSSEKCSIGTHACGSDNSLTCCDSTCSPPSCSWNGGTDNDNDGYDDQCEDCNDNDPDINIGLSELDNCDVYPNKNVFKPGCFCLDGKDNDCNGDIDLGDSICPDLDKDWWIQGVVEDLANLPGFSKGIWVVGGATLNVDVDFIIPEQMVVDNNSKVVIKTKKDLKIDGKLHIRGSSTVIVRRGATLRLSNTNGVELDLNSRIVACPEPGFVIECFGGSGTESTILFE